jgi:rhodanese-related sulfurtransferase
MRRALLLVTLSLLACGSAEEARTDGGTLPDDSGVTGDAGTTSTPRDGGELNGADGGHDAGTAAADAGAPDAGPATAKGATARAIVADGGRLVDVRTESEYAAGHIEGARNIPLQVLPQRTAELEPKDDWVVVYCRSGSRSAQAAGILADGGFTHVFDLGPMTNW